MSALSFCRGERAARIFARYGIDGRIYWLLVDLFGQLSERGEVLENLGQNTPALKVVAWMYGALSVLISLLQAAMGSKAPWHYGAFLAITVFVLLGCLLSEAGNSLLNPAEAAVLSHQPINGATYTAAKLTHLLRIVLYLVPAINLPPALAGWIFEHQSWWLPMRHMAASFALGLLCALASCASFGWLMRLVPARRIKAFGQFAATIPFLGLMFLMQLQKWMAHVDIRRWLPVRAAAAWSLAIAAGVGAAAIIVLGLRSLSADYLIRVSAMLHTGRSRRRRLRFQPGEAIAGWQSGPSGRAGYAYLSRMMLRDWQFRRQILPMSLPLLGILPLLGSGWKTDPFSGTFSSVYVFPYACGLLLFFVCALLPFGNDYKGAWLFLSIPTGALKGFTRGLHLLLWMRMVLVPHLLVWPFLAWFWGPWHAALFVVYGLAAASILLALELRLIECIPFTRQMSPVRNAVLLPALILGSIAVAIVVAVQHYFLFRSPTLVAVAASIAGGIAWRLTGNSLGAMEASLRYHLGLLSDETGDLYREVL